jgi:hypothetical protein
LYMIIHLTRFITDPIFKPNLVDNSFNPYKILFKSKYLV